MLEAPVEALERYARWLGVTLPKRTRLNYHFELARRCARAVKKRGLRPA